MAKLRGNTPSPVESVISIIGPGMRVVGDCETTGTIRIEGTVHGSVKAAKAVVVGRDGVVEGDITTQDAVISGSVKGTLIVESRLELQSTCQISGEIQAVRLQLEEGAVLNGTVSMGSKTGGQNSPTGNSSSSAGASTAGESRVS